MAEEQINKVCSDAHLVSIADFIADWRALSPYLNLTEAEENAILGSNPYSVPTQKIAMLRKWKQKLGAKATYKKLCEDCKRFQDCDLVEKIEAIFTKNRSSLEDEEFQGHISTNSINSEYAFYLKNLYTSMSHCHSHHHWTHLPRCEYIKLAMTEEEEEVRRGGPEEEMIRLAQQGKIETILGHKKSVDLHNLIPLSEPLVVLPPPPPPPPCKCLIEGAPGGGKSTLALHICHQWAQGASWLARFDVVILAYLRDEAIQNAYTLTDILPANTMDKFTSVASQMTASSGEKVLFIFDGWDEFSSDLMDNSLVSTIIQQPHKLSLHRSTIIITTRPVSSGNLLSKIDKRVEILGFTQHQIHEYIEKALKNNYSQFQKLIQHLDEHPVIEGYCYVPLHAAILVHIFLTMKGVLPTTLHELFHSLVICCITREQATHELNSTLNLPEPCSLDDLPDYLKPALTNLSVLAYNGLMQDKVIFYSRDMQASHLPLSLPSLGLLQAVEGLTLYSKSISYNFLHLSVQELLAAYHISQMSSSDQLAVFKEMSKSSCFQAVLYHVCGFTKLEDPEILELISSYQHDNSTPSS